MKSDGHDSLATIIISKPLRAALDPNPVPISLRCTPGCCLDSLRDWPTAFQKYF